MTRLQRKRQVERIPLTFPIVGKVGSLETVIVDLSLMGCRLEHHYPLKVGDSVRLSFSWGDESIAFMCHVVRCKFNSSTSRGEGFTVYHSGLRFIEDVDGSGRRLRSLIHDQISRALAEQKANARGEVPKYLDHMPIFRGAGVMAVDAKDVQEVYEGSSTLLPWIRIARERGYICCRFERRKWKMIRTREPDQPDEGFTVWGYEDEKHIDLLMEAYENGDEGTKRLIRLCAELSLIVDDSIPPQRFQP